MLFVIRYEHVIRVLLYTCICIKLRLNITEIKGCSAIQSVSVPGSTFQTGDELSMSANKSMRSLYTTTTTTTTKLSPYSSFYLTFTPP